MSYFVYKLLTNNEVTCPHVRNISVVTDETCVRTLADHLVLVSVSRSDNQFISGSQPSETISKTLSSGDLASQ